MKVLVVGEVYELVCCGVNPKTQDGIFKFFDGKVIIVKDAKLHHKYKVRVLKVLDRYAFGEIV